MIWKNTAKWFLITLLIGLIGGIGSYIFLRMLDITTNARISHPFFIYLLPVAGLGIGLAYYYFGTEETKGNNKLIDEIYKPKQCISFKMAPIVLFSTLFTHLVGASAGREGTALQITASISDQLSKIFKLTNQDRTLVLLAAVSAGFGSVFGTPLAGAIFALEIFFLKKIKIQYIPVIVSSAYFAHYICLFLGTKHTMYTINILPKINAPILLYCTIIGIVSGMASYFYKFMAEFIAKKIQYIIKFPPLRPAIGGLFLLIIFLLFDTKRYMGLGISTIQQSFISIQKPEIFLIKILFTAFTLSVGFKGGEVTPLFFIGATLGSALFLFIPLPISILAAMGFVAVFAGATNTPIASTILGIELFGFHTVAYVSIACFIAYFFSGEKSIYSSQKLGKWKIFKG